MDETHEDLVSGSPDDWREVMEHRIKGRVLLWRCLTMNLVRLASGITSRYKVDYVTELITRKLGQWFTPRKGAS